MEYMIFLASDIFLKNNYVMAFEIKLCYQPWPCTSTFMLRLELKGKKNICKLYLSLLDNNNTNDKHDISRRWHWLKAIYLEEAC